MTLGHDPVGHPCEVESLYDLAACYCDYIRAGHEK